MRKGKKEYLDKIALHNAWFLEHFIVVEEIPKISADPKGGGAMFMGFSMGSAFITVEVHIR